MMIYIDEGEDDIDYYKVYFEFFEFECYEIDKGELKDRDNILRDIV